MQQTLSGVAGRVNTGVRAAATMIVLPIALVLACLYAIASGAADLGAGEIWASVAARMGVGSDPLTARQQAIVWELRMPRVLVGALVGAALSVGGATLQALVRNVLADPYLLGVSSGAGLGAAGVIALGLGAALGGVTLVGGAFLGACLAVVLLLLLTGRRGAVAVHHLVLAGLVVSFFLSAVTNLVVSVAGDRDTVRAIMFWTLGSLARADWTHLPVLALVVLGMLAALTLIARRLDAISLGDDVARSLGTDPGRLRVQATAITAIGVAAAVAVSGAVGFVGLVVPHLTRSLVGASHRVLLPTCALLGALVIVVGDTLARTVLAPRELPLGVLTALLGTPLLMVLVRRQGERP
ncbi:FecCD family ABC transporter permease [Mobilicoccus massiliensis]|uniref:FecCD family ABC transporter permease n=1 Tax=Mobilicoccus massiliensis TaxID=1522310 RepID=UPI0006949960|nr:iron ABC transporter permease [Mobilicoccus massiliensis]